MQGIDVNGRIEYRIASLRYFERGERHVSRFCRENVLLMVFDGVLRFREDGVDHEVRAGEYHIQRACSAQEGILASDEPKYLYVHFDAEWAERGELLPARGVFDHSSMKESMRRMDRLAHGGACRLELNAALFDILSTLYKGVRTRSVTERIAEYLAKNRREELSLDGISDHFHFSKNHIINIFKQDYSVTPMDYLVGLRLDEAEWLLESTAASVGDIAYECGFNSYSNFYRHFYARHGSSPANWRRERRTSDTDN